MTQTDKRFPEAVTMGEKYGPLSRIENQLDARSYFDWCVEHTLYLMERNGDVKPREEVENIERQNIAYFAGYFSPETAQRVRTLFNVGGSR